MDTTFFLDLHGRGGRQRARRAEAKLIEWESNRISVTTTRLNVAELYVGVARASDPVRETKLIEWLIESFDVLELDDLAAREFGKISAALAEIGLPIGGFDALIAAIAIVNGQTLVTNNTEHFARVPGLTVESY